MVYRNDSGGALERPNDMQWPRYDVLGAEAQDGDGNLLAGAVVALQGINSVDDLFGSSPEFVNYIANGQLTRVYNGVDVPAGVPSDRVARHSMEPPCAMTGGWASPSETLSTLTESSPSSGSFPPYTGALKVIVV